MADTKAPVGRKEPHTRRHIVQDSVTVLEQLLRMTAEERAEGDGGMETVRVNGVGCTVSFRRARASASQRTLQSLKAVARRALELGTKSLLEWLRSVSRRPPAMYRSRHDLSHTVGIVRFDDAGLFDTAESLAHVRLGGSPREMVARGHVEGAHTKEV